MPLNQGIVKNIEMALKKHIIINYGRKHTALKCKITNTFYQ